MDKKTNKLLAWEVNLITFTGDHFYPFRVEGLNHYRNGEVFSWRVPNLDSASYDLSGAVFTGVTALEGMSNG